MTKEEIKAMEEVAKRRLGCYVMDDRYRQLYGRREALYEAMSEYATQCTAPLEARIRELEDGLREWPGMSADYQKIEKWELRLKDLISGVATYSSDGWISVKEGLPEDKQYVFVYCSVKGFQSTNYAITQYSKQYGFESASSVTHWQPLPKPPNTNTQQH